VPNLTRCYCPVITTPLPTVATLVNTRTPRTAPWTIWLFPITHVYLYTALPPVTLTHCVCYVLTVAVNTPRAFPRFLRSCWFTFVLVIAHWLRLVVWTVYAVYRTLQHVTVVVRYLGSNV